MDEREKKLPKWAQDELRNLRRTVDQYSERDLAASEEHPDTKVFIRDGLDLIPLPKDSQIEFQITDQFSVAVCVGTQDWERETLYVNGRRAVTIQPRAANAFYVKEDKS